MTQLRRAVTQETRCRPREGSELRSETCRTQAKQAGAARACVSWGGWQLSVDGLDVPLERREQRLTALLGLTDAARRARVAGILWPESTRARALARLRRAVLQSQRRCPGLLLADRTDIGLHPDVVVDVDEVRRASRLTEKPMHRVDAEAPLAALVGEPLLPAWSDDWVLPEREHIEQLRVRALERIARHAFTRGQLRSRRSTPPQGPSLAMVRAAPRSPRAGVSVAVAEDPGPGEVGSGSGPDGEDFRPSDPAAAGTDATAAHGLRAAATPRVSPRPWTSEAPERGVDHARGRPRRRRCGRRWRLGAGGDPDVSRPASAPTSRRPRAAPSGGRPPRSRSAAAAQNARQLVVVRPSEPRWESPRWWCGRAASRPQSRSWCADRRNAASCAASCVRSLGGPRASVLDELSPAPTDGSHIADRQPVQRRDQVADSRRAPASGPAPDDKPARVDGS